MRHFCWFAGEDLATSVDRTDKTRELFLAIQHANPNKQTYVAYTNVHERRDRLDRSPTFNLPFIHYEDNQMLPTMLKGDTPGARADISACVELMGAVLEQVEGKPYFVLNVHTFAQDVVKMLVVCSSEVYVSNKKGKRKTHRKNDYNVTLPEIMHHVIIPQFGNNTTIETTFINRDTKFPRDVPEQHYDLIWFAGCGPMKYFCTNAGENAAAKMRSLFLAIHDADPTKPTYVVHTRGRGAGIWYVHEDNPKHPGSTRFKVPRELRTDLPFQQPFLHHADRSQASYGSKARRARGQSTDINACVELMSTVLEQVEGKPYFTLNVQDIATTTTTSQVDKRGRKSSTTTRTSKRGKKSSTTTGKRGKKSSTTTGKRGKKSGATSRAGKRGKKSSTTTGKQSKQDVGAASGQSAQDVTAGVELYNAPILYTFREGATPGNLTCFHDAQGRRDEMEDDAVVAQLGPDVWYYAVLDGHGGAHASKHFANVIPGALLERMRLRQRIGLLPPSEHTRYNLDEDVVRSGAREAFMKEDKKYYDQEHNRIDGTTLTSVLITPTHIYTINLGDSRTIIQQGDNLYATVDHKPNDKNERKRVETAGGFVREGRVMKILAVSRALGDNEFKSNATYFDAQNGSSSGDDISLSTENLVRDSYFYERSMVSPVPVVQSYERMGDETIIVACDGAYDVLHNNEIIEIYERGQCKAIVGQALLRGSTDNITVMAIEL